MSDLSAWHDAWAGVAAAAVSDAVASHGLAVGARVLDVGTGGGVALPALANAVGPDGRVVGIDIEASSVALARRRVGDYPTISLEARDVGSVIGTTAPGSVDAIWAGDVLWRNYFDNPADLVRRLVGLLAPGGILAVFTGNWYSSRFLYGHPELERRVLAASARRWAVAHDGDATHHEHAPAWLEAAGLREVRMQIYPMVGTATGSNWVEWQRYLQVGVWPDYLAAVRAHAPDVGMEAADAGRLEALITPGTPRYLPAQPGYVAFQPAMLVAGRRCSAQGTRNAHSETHYGIYAFTPASPLALVDPGVDRFTGTMVFLESHKRNEFLVPPARDWADVARFGDCRRPCCCRPSCRSGCCCWCTLASPAIAMPACCAMSPASP